MSIKNAAVVGAVVALSSLVASEALASERLFHRNRGGSTTCTQQVTTPARYGYVRKRVLV